LLKKLHIGQQLRTLVFDQSIERLEMLVPTQFTYHSKKKDDSAITNFSSGEAAILGAVNALNEGVNLPNVDLIVVMGFNSNSRHTVQRIGRGIRYRPNHTTRVIMLYSAGTKDEEWCHQALTDIPQQLIQKKFLSEILQEKS